MAVKIMRPLFAAALAVLVMANPAQAGYRGDLTHAAKQLRHKVVKRHGADAAGRDIIKYGIVFTTSAHTKAIRRPKIHELRRYKRQLNRILAPPALPQMTRQVGPPPQAPAGVQSTYSVPPSGIAQCESGGDPTAVSADGQYRGKWQFDQQTWESVGGTGDPAAAPEAVQDKLAGKLYTQRGSAPWPVCGR
jgi:hypothetical protein